MNTVDDLNLVLRDLEHCAPDLDDVRRRLAAAEPAAPRRSVRRFVLPSAAAAAVAAVSIVAITLTSGDGEHRSVPPGHASPPPTSARPTPTSTPPPPVTDHSIDLTWRFAVQPVPGYTIVRESISATDQMARVTQKNANKDIGEIDVYNPGVVPRELHALRHGHKISVRGHRGYFAVIGHRSATIWQYAHEAWAEVSGDWGYSASGVDPNAALMGELQIADAVDTSRSAPLRIDFTLGYLPSGLKLRNTIFWANPFGQGPLCELDFVDDVAGQASGGSTVAAVTITRTGVTQDTGQPGNSAFTPNMTVGGRPAQYSTGFLAVRYPNGTELSISVDKKHVGRYPKSELVKIAEHAAPAGDPSAPSTWATGSKAVPQ